MKRLLFAAVPFLASAALACESQVFVAVDREAIPPVLVSSDAGLDLDGDPDVGKILPPSPPPDASLSSDRDASSSPDTAP